MLNQYVSLVKHKEQQLVSCAGGVPKNQGFRIQPSDKVSKGSAKMGNTRGNSYTMVFSMNLIRENRSGRAIAVPCKRPINNTADLIEEAKRLWVAEDNKKYFSGISTCKEWGRIALLENPDCPMPTELLDGWGRHVSSEAHYRKMKKPLICEETAVNEDGFLKIPWPKLEDGSPLAMDALLAFRASTSLRPHFIKKIMVLFQPFILFSLIIYFPIFFLSPGSVSRA